MNAAVSVQLMAPIRASLLLARVTKTWPEDIALDSLAPAHKVLGVDQVNNTRCDLGQRAGIGRNTEFAETEALGDRQSPSLIQRRIYREEAIVVKPI